jgi:hypothetical protein
MPTIYGAPHLSTGRGARIPAIRRADPGRRKIQGQRASQPSKKRFTVRRIIGGGDLWVTEFVLTYDGKPSYTASIMEFSGDKVAREIQYFADPFLLPYRALNGSNGWTHKIEALDFDRNPPDSDLSSPGLREARTAGDFSRFNGWNKRTRWKRPQLQGKNSTATKLALF